MSPDAIIAGHIYADYEDVVRKVTLLDVSIFPKTNPIRRCRIVWVRGPTSRYICWFTLSEFAARMKEDLGPDPVEVESWPLLPEP